MNGSHQEKIRVNGLDGVLCRPNGEANAGILVLPMLYGADPTACQFGARFAEAGYAAIVWDPYSGKGPPQSERDGHKKFLRTLDDEGSREEQRFWLTHLLEQEGVVSVAAIGWCLGGRDVFRLAAVDRRLAAIVSYYPTIKTPLPENQHEDAVAMAAGVRCPVLFGYSGNERSTTAETLDGIEHNLKNRPYPTVVDLHPRADHGFMDPLRHAGPENAAAAKLAWALTLAFLGVHLQDPSKSSLEPARRTA